ncbi:hypothetical protein ABH935_006373 [Catenulispora sp. GAS73]|uniref:hypothetical protein n=1 Tax=Catenulispora sp. GAS73 TaxID=3156269 RepID=UPI003519233F
MASQNLADGGCGDPVAQAAHLALDPGVAPRRVVPRQPEVQSDELWLGQDPKVVCRVVLNDLDRIDLVDAERLVREAREMVSVWPKVAILATTQPGTTMDRAVRLDVDLWSAERGAKLMKVASDVELPWRQWNSETTDLLRRPLSALALAT